MDTFARRMSWERHLRTLRASVLFGACLFCVGCSSTHKATENAAVLTFHPATEEATEGAVRITHPSHSSITLYYDPNRKLTDIRVESVIQRPCEATCWISARFHEKDTKLLKEFRQKYPSRNYIVFMNDAPLTVVDLSELGKTEGMSDPHPRQIYAFVSRSTTDDQSQLCKQLTGR